MCSPHTGLSLLFRVKAKVSRMSRVRAWIGISMLTFGVNGFVGAKDVDLKTVMVGPAFVVPMFAVALGFDIAAQQ